MGVILNFSQHDQRNQVAPLLPVKLAFYLSPNKDKNFFLTCQVFFLFFFKAGSGIFRSPFTPSSLAGRGSVSLRTEPKINSTLGFGTPSVRSAVGTCESPRRDTPKLPGITRGGRPSHNGRRHTRRCFLFTQQR